MLDYSQELPRIEVHGYLIIKDLLKFIYGSSGAAKVSVKMIKEVCPKKISYNHVVHESNIDNALAKLVPPDSARNKIGQRLKAFDSTLFKKVIHARQEMNPGLEQLQRLFKKSTNLVEEEKKNPYWVHESTSSYILLDETLQYVIVQGENVSCLSPWEYKPNTRHGRVMYTVPTEIAKKNWTDMGVPGIPDLSEFDIEGVFEYVNRHEEIDKEIRDTECRHQEIRAKHYERQQELQNQIDSELKLMHEEHETVRISKMCIPLQRELD